MKISSVLLFIGLALPAMCEPYRQHLRSAVGASTKDTSAAEDDADVSIYALPEERSGMSRRAALRRSAGGRVVSDRYARVTRRAQHRQRADTPLAYPPTPTQGTFSNSSNGSSPSPVPTPTECVRSGRQTLLGGEALPKSVRALVYDLRLDLPDPNAEDLAYAGHARGLVEAVEGTTCFMVHSRGLTKQSFNVTVNGVEAEFDLVREEDNEWDVVMLKGNSTLRPGDRAQFSVAYTAAVATAAPDGIYRGANAVGEHDAGRMIATHMQYLHARSVFPCLDEPAFKALWSAEISIPATAHAQGTVVLFNTPHAAVAADGDRQRYTFPKTLIPIAPYLVALSVGRFDTVSRADTNGLVHEIVGPAGSKAYLSYALDASIAIVGAYETHLYASKYGYRLGQLCDRVRHVASAFAGGAMENLGLIIYANANLLVNPTGATLAERQRVTVVMAHELAHMWFGDLVTTEDWRQLFNNEGMAEYMQYVAVAKTNPTWNLWGSTTGEGYFYNKQRAMLLDLAGTTSPVIVNETLKGDNNAITYVKGCAINRFLQTWLGESAFADAMSQHYLSPYAKGNADISQWLEAVDKVTPASSSYVLDAAKDLLFKAGFPVVTLSATVDEATNTVTVGASQSPIAVNPNTINGGGLPAGQRWTVALNLAVRLADEPSEPTGTVVNSVAHFATESATWDFDVSKDAAGKLKGNVAVIPEAEFYGLVRYDTPKLWHAAIGRAMQVAGGATQASRVQFLRGVAMLVESSHDKLGLLASTTRYATPLCVAPFDNSTAPGTATVGKSNAIEMISTLLKAWEPIARAVESNATLVEETRAGIATLVRPAAKDLGFGFVVPGNGTNNGTVNATEAEATGASASRRTVRLVSPTARSEDNSAAAAPAVPQPRRVTVVAADSDESEERVSAAKGSRTRRARHVLSGAARRLLGDSDDSSDNNDANGAAAAADEEIARTTVMFYAVYFDVDDYREQAVRVYEGFRKEEKQVPADVLAAVLYGTMRSGTAEDVGHLIDEYVAMPNNASAKADFAIALGGARTEDCGRAIGELAKTGDGATTAVALERLASSIRLNPECKDIAWTQFKTLAPAYWSEEGRTTREIERTPLLSDHFIGAFSSEAEYNDVRDFLLAHTDKLPMTFIDSVLGRVLLGVNVLRTNSDQEPYVPPVVTPTPTPNPSPSPEPEKKGSSSKVLYIVLGVAGGLALLGGVGYFAMRKPSHERVPGFDSPLVRDSRSQYTG